MSKARRRHPFRSNGHFRGDDFKKSSEEILSLVSPAAKGEDFFRVGGSGVEGFSQDPYLELDS
jgi:hypothetical protein